MGRGDRSRRLGRWARVTAVGLFGSVAVVAVPSAAHAENTITVTTTADVVNGGDGVTSLREAFTLANTDGDDSVIELSPGATYSLTICVPKVPIDYGTGFFGSPADDDANADGDLDHTAAHDLTIEGHGATITNTCQYDRVIDNLHSSSWLTLHDVTATGGDSPPGEAVAIGSPGGATLDGVRIEDSTRTIGSAIAAVAVGDPSGAGGIVPRLEMTDTVIVASGRNGVRVDWGTSTITDSAIYDAPADGVSFSHGTMTISGSTFVDNGGNGVSGIDGALYVTDSVAGGNGGAGFRTTGNAASGYPLHLDGVRAIQNGTGVDCSYCTDLLIEHSTISLSGGNGVRAIANLVGPTFHIEDSSITDNDASAYFSGGAITMTADPRPHRRWRSCARRSRATSRRPPAQAARSGCTVSISTSTAHVVRQHRRRSRRRRGHRRPGSVTLRASTIADNVGGSGGDNPAVQRRG
ncbi:MAG: right-handed parallel beta-helix repeat-containing protein [Ilumatobacteraceae bacterium]